MKLVTFSHDGKSKTGALVGPDTLIDLDSCGSALAIATDAKARAQADKLIAAATPGDFIALDSHVKLLAPWRPGSIICIGLNYMDHCRETNSPIPSKPVVFGKFANSLAGPGDTISWASDASSEVDYEAELGVMIGKDCSQVSKEQALSYVGGYVCVNDISARDLQMSDGGKQWTLGKTLDGFCPIGPALVTPDEIADPQALDIACILNGARVQNSNTREMIFDIATLISHLSRYITLRAGDLIATGTPFGVGMSRTPKLWLKDGDTVTIEVAGVGSLTNQIAVR